MLQVDPSIQVQNVVASVTLGQPIDLISVVRALPESVKYDPEQFPGLLFKLKKPKTAILIFATGKMVCTGARSEKLARDAVRKVLQELKEHGILILGQPRIEVQNIVATASIGGKVDLEKTAYALGKTIYEPEMFPGLIYRMDTPKAVFLVFSSGKLVCVGTKREEEMRQAVRQLKARLEEKDLIYYEGPVEKP